MVEYLDGPRLHLAPAARGHMELTGPAAEQYVQSLTVPNSDGTRRFVTSMDPLPTINIVMTGVMHHSYNVKYVADSLAYAVEFDFSAPKIVGVGINR
jgi:hypothetical protein